MEGLIKGLIDVALGAGDGDGDRNAGVEARPDSPPEQRSRSTWAEVVSSGNAESEQESSYGEHSAAWGSRKEVGDGDWEVAGHKKHHQSPTRRPHQEKAEVEQQDGSFGRHSNAWSARKEESDSNGDWEVVNRKKQQSGRTHQVPVDNWLAYKQPPCEQKYCDHVGHGVNLEPSREELGNLLEACSRLWELDSNRLVPGKDYEIDCGEGKKVYHKGDMASGSLFSWISDDVLRRPTFARFSSLLDNYNPEVGHEEVVTSQEKHEQTSFIEEISRTAPIKYLHKYLTFKGITSGSNEEFKELMESLWFNLYGRGGRSRSSSAFEHVFVGEIKGRGENEVSGFHNWIQFYLEEAKGKVDYQGYIFPRRRGEIPDSETQLLTIQFEWNGVLKSVSSILIGVSPEFEIALFTLCFFMGGEDNYVRLGPYSVNIKCYRLGNDKIGSVFPIAEG